MQAVREGEGSRLVAGSFKRAVAVSATRAWTGLPSISWKIVPIRTCPVAIPGAVASVPNQLRIATGQVLIGTIFQLNPNGKPVQARVAETATALLKEPVTATVAPFPLPDGLH